MVLYYSHFICFFFIVTALTKYLETKLQYPNCKYRSILRLSFFYNTRVICCCDKFRISKKAMNEIKLSINKSTQQNSKKKYASWLSAYLDVPNKFDKLSKNIVYGVLAPHKSEASATVQSSKI